MATRKDLPEARDARPIKVEIERKTIEIYAQPVKVEHKVIEVVSVAYPQASTKQTLPAPADDVDEGPALLARLETAQTKLIEALQIIGGGKATDAERLRAKTLQGEADDTLRAMRNYLKDQRRRR